MRTDTAEHFLYEANKARNASESTEVIRSILSFINKKQKVIETLMTELSRSKIFIKIAKAASENEITMTTRKTGTKPTIDIQYTPADINKVARSWNVLVELDEIIDRLNGSILPRHISLYKHTPGLDKTVKVVEDTISRYKKMRTNILKALKATGTKFIPRNLNKLISVVKDNVEKGLEGRFATCDITVYPTVVKLKKEYVLSYYCYIQFTDLVTDDSWVHDVFTILVVGIPTEEEWKYQLHIFEGDVLPPNVDNSSGQWITSDVGIRNQVIMQLASIHALNVLKPQAFPLTKEKALKAGMLLSEVSDVDVEGQYLKIVLKSSIRSKAQVEEVSKKLFPIVKRSLDIESRVRLASRQTTQGSCAVLLYRINPTSQKDKKINMTFDLSHIEELTIKSGMDPKVARKLATVLKQEKFDQLNKISPAPLENVEIHYDKPVNVKPNPEDIKKKTSLKKQEEMRAKLARKRKQAILDDEDIEID